jgi:hypothetical protein
MQPLEYTNTVKKKKHLTRLIDKCLVVSVIRAGFEPTTHSLEGCCSIQLSYRTPVSFKLQKYSKSENKKNLRFSSSNK